MTVIDEYLKKFDKHQRSKLERIRTIVKKVVPDAEETISYAMPTFKYKGRSFFGFDLHKEHIGLYPYGGEAIEVFKEKLSQYGLSKGAIRVPLDVEFPENLLKQIITYRISQIVRQK